MSETVQKQNDRPPENMQLMIDALNASSDIVVIGGFERTFIDPHRCPPTTGGAISHRLEIFTHPVTPLYEPAALNELATAVIGDIPATHVDPAEWVQYTRTSSPQLKLPKWHVDDTIGSVTLQGAIEPNPDSTVVKTGLLPPTTPLKYDFKLLQRTIVTIFPDIHYVAEAARGEVEYREPVLRVPLQESQEEEFTRLLMHAPALGGTRSLEIENMLVVRDAVRNIPEFIIDNAP